MLNNITLTCKHSYVLIKKNKNGVLSAEIKSLDLEPTEPDAGNAVEGIDCENIHDDVYISFDCTLFGFAVFL